MYATHLKYIVKAFESLPRKQTKLVKNGPGCGVGGEVARHKRGESWNAPCEEHCHVGCEDRNEDAIGFAERVPDSVRFVPKKIA